MLHQGRNTREGKKINKKERTKSNSKNDKRENQTNKTALPQVDNSKVHQSKQILNHYIVKEILIMFVQMVYYL
jgi:hypothetical protein